MKTWAAWQYCSARQGLNAANGHARGPLKHHILQAPAPFGLPFVAKGNCFRAEVVSNDAFQLLLLGELKLFNALVQ